MTRKLKAVKYTMLAASLSLVIACEGMNNKSAESKASHSNQAATPQTQGSGQILAVVNGENITEKDIEDVAGAQLRRAQLSMYEAQRAGVEQIIEERLIAAEAKKRNVSETKLVQDEVNNKVKVEDAAIEQYYNQRKASFKDKSLEEIKPTIKSYLFQQEFQKARRDFVSELRKKSDVKINIEPPRADIVVGDHPTRGKENAPVTLIECTDYQCPFCGRAQDTIQQVLKEYDGKILYSLRDFPLSFHKDAFKAHEAAHCAGDQGKYWEYNQKLFGNQRALTVDDLGKYAKELKLDQKKFDECLSSDQYAKKVQDSIQACAAAGVTGTPAFFINGRMISGARPFESFQEVIEDELN